MLEVSKHLRRLLHFHIEMHTPNYEQLAMDPIPALKKDPNLLFKIVNSCGAPVLFIDLISVSVQDKDLIDIKNIDWFKLTKHLPLSIFTLERYIGKVDWEYISTSCDYAKNEEFIRKFYKYLNMKTIQNLTLTENQAINLVFEDKILPFHAIPMKIMLPKVKEKNNIGYIGSSIYNTTSFIKLFGAKETEETFADTSITINICPHEFETRCRSDKYVPQTERFIDILKKGVKHWRSFLISCKPDIEFIEKNIVPDASQNTWYDISECPQLTATFIEAYAPYLYMRKVAQHYQFDTPTLKRILGDWKAEYGSLSIYTRLTPEFIDEYADKLDWYNLCEHQNLPEWLLNKYKDKINWGQISLYQPLTQKFIQENKNMLNEVKLSQNKRLI